MDQAEGEGGGRVRLTHHFCASDAPYLNYFSEQLFMNPGHIHKA
jgi:hypothetical protein